MAIKIGITAMKTNLIKKNPRFSFFNAPNLTMQSILKTVEALFATEDQTEKRVSNQLGLKIEIKEITIKNKKMNPFEFKACNHAD